VARTLSSWRDASNVSIPLPEHGHFRGDRADIFSDDGYPLAVLHIHQHIAIGLHTHDFFELVLILSGRALHLTQDASYPLAPGDAFVIKPGFAHGYSNPHDLELCNILFDPVGLALPRGELSHLPGYHGLFELEPSFRDTHRFQSRLFLAPVARQRVMEWVEVLEEELHARQDGYRFLSLALLIRIIGFLARMYTDMTAPASRTLLAVSKAVSHIEHNYAAELSLKDLARMAHMCERSLQRYFQQAFGVPPVDYINRLRIRRACQLLGEGQLNITQVADAVGLPDSSYFARVFRHFTGTTPSAYQRSSHHLQQAMHPLALAKHPRRTGGKTNAIDSNA
jgi:AraC-like DNA-binding protein